MSEFLTWMVYLGALQYRRTWWAKRAKTSFNTRNGGDHVAYHKDYPCNHDFWELDKALGMPPLGNLLTERK